MADGEDERTRLVRQIASDVVELLRWDREEQRAEAFEEILLVVDAGVRRLDAARGNSSLDLFARLRREPGRN